MLTSHDFPTQGKLTFNQVLGFSKATKQQIEQLQQYLNNQQQMLYLNNKVALESANEQLLGTSELTGKVDSYSKVSEKNQNRMDARIENLQNQVANLNTLAEVLKNGYLIQKQIGAGEKGERLVDNPNRTEEIKDKESGITVLNHYKNDKLLSSEMTKGIKKTYEVEYDPNGSILCSRNYGENGELTTELQFYPNGQIKTRTEKVTINGKVQSVTSRFDGQGNKKG